MESRKKLLAAPFLKYLHGEKMNEQMFDDLPDHLKVEILCRLPLKVLTRFKCVSKTWSCLITSSCIPIMASALPYSGIVFQKEFYPRVYGYPLRHVCNQCPEGSHSLNLPFIQCLSSHGLADCCNGLLLIRRLCMALHTIEDQLSVYHVVNPLTKQHVAVAKPGSNTPRPKFVALAYHPSESSYFKIVQFQDTSCMNMYSSETGIWSSLKFQLEKNVTAAMWARQSVYFEGALYRLSMSGHVLRFVVDKEISEEAQAQATKIPETTNFLRIGCIGLSNGLLNFAIPDASNLKVWVLNHQSSCCPDYSEWSLKYSIPCHDVIGFHSRFGPRPIVFHPYSDAILVAFIDNKILKIKCYHHSEQPLRGSTLDTKIEFHICRLADIRIRFFPYLECGIPFAALHGLDAGPAKLDLDEMTQRHISHFMMENPDAGTDNYS